MTPQSSYSPQNIKDEEKSKISCFFNASYLLFYEVGNFVDMFLGLQLLTSEITRWMKIKLI